MKQITPSFVGLVLTFIALIALLTTYLLGISNIFLELSTIGAVLVFFLAFYHFVIEPRKFLKKVVNKK